MKLITRCATEVTNTGKGEAPWCVRWQTTAMSAPAFWYYETEQEAQDTARLLRQVPKLAEKGIVRDRRRHVSLS